MADAKPKNPIQPFVTDERGTLRFKKNLIVKALVDHASKTGFDLNDIGVRFGGPEHSDDHQQARTAHRLQPERL